jgi:DnaJ-class molecular chaperone
MRVIRRRRLRGAPKRRRTTPTPSERAELKKAVELERLYDVFGLVPWSTIAEVKSRYRQLAMKFHPDRNPAGGDQMTRINAAYHAILASKERRFASPSA